MSMYDSSHSRGNKVLVLLGMFCAFGLGIFIDFILQIPPVPVMEYKLWGSKHDDRIRKFEINISCEIIDDLKYRLNNIRPFQESIEGSQQNYGMSTNVINKFLDFWSNKYIWKERENYLNQYPNYKTSIQGLDIHFLWIKPKTKKRIIPILLLHGWISTFRDFYDLVPLMTKDNKEYDFVFEIIAPSLPGFIFSDASSKSELGSPEIGLIMKNLMQRLGHDKFYIFGSDLGCFIVHDMAVLFPNNVLGMYSQISISFRYISLFKYGLESYLPINLGNTSKFSILDAAKVLWDEAGYFHNHVTKPDTIGVAMSDSPIGLATYFLQIYSSGGDVLKNRNLDDAGLSIYDYTAIADTIMLYWVTNNLKSSMRYTDIIHSVPKLFQIPINYNVPCSCPIFKHEIFYHSKWILRDKFTNIIQSTEFDHTHFPLIEKNETLKIVYADDIFSSVMKMLKFKNITGF